MIRSLFSAVSGLENLQNGMDVVGNNIANVDTTGFKSQEATFQDMLYQSLRAGSATTAGGAGAVNPSNVGTGMNLAEVTNDMSQGTLQNTGRTLGLAIQGNGWFSVQDAAGDIYYKRDGVFNLDATNNLVDENGNVLLDNGGPPGAAINLGATALATVNIAQNGVITYTTTAAPTVTVPGPTIGLSMFPDQEALTRVGDNLYTANATLTGPITNSQPTTAGTGSINSGYLESSNVNLANEFANLIVTERSYEANTKMITTSDQMLLDLMNLKAGA